MVNTVKFSQFATAPLTSSSTGIVGLESGVNIQSVRWPVWTTAGRPTPPFNGLLGVNSDLHQYEWYDGFAAQWFQIPDSGDIAALIARLAAHTVGDGASMIGLQNQSNVTNKTVQDLANAQFVVNVNNGSLQNAQSLGSLTTGIVKNTTVTGVLSISAPLTQIDNLSPVQGDILYHNGSAWVLLAPGTPGFILQTQGAGANPQWVMDVNSGTVTSFSSGDLSPLFTTSVANPTTTPALSFSLTNAAANTYFGNATSGSAAPSYTAAGALTKTDDTNVTLTLGGSPTVALLASTSLTLGWTGVLSLARGGTNKNITAVAGAVVWSDADSFELTAAGSSGQIFQSTGTTAPGWTTATYPSLAGTSGNVISSNGTNFVSSTLSSVMDAVFGSAQGDILYRNAAGWVVLAPGTNGFFLQTQGAAANPIWSAGNSGSVTSITAGTGLTSTPNPITTTGTIELAAIADHTLLANISGGALAPSSTTLTALIDNAIGNTQGNILYRNASAWVVLAPGTSGQFLQTQGAAANPQWAPGDGAGTVTSITQGSGVTFSSTPITSSGTISANQQNSIIGGNFDTNPWQRGVSFAALADNSYSADRFNWQNGSDAVATILKTADAPTVAEAGIFSSNCFHVDITTADGTIGAGQYAFVCYFMEGYDWAQLAQRTFTLSFWVKSTKTGIFCVSFCNSGTDRTYVAEYTINTTDTWEKKSITVSASPSAGTWNYTNGRGVRIGFALAAGSTFQTTANAWNTGNFVATSNQVNALDSTSNNFKLQLIKVEPGSVATGWVNRSEEEELALCQRYYEKSYTQGLYAGSTVSGGYSGLGGLAGGATITSFNESFAVTKRAAPTVTVYSPSAGTSGNIDSTGGGTPAAGGAGGIGDSGFQASFNAITGTAIQFHWIAEAEL